MPLLWEIAHSNGATLSLGGTKAAIDNNVAPGQGAIRGNIGWATGKRYLEWDVVDYDGIFLGWTSSNGALFPGNAARGAGYANNASFAGLWQNWGGGSTNGGAGGPLLNAPIRIGGMLDIDNNIAQILSVAHPAGTDIYTMTGLWGGQTVYPAMGSGFGVGAPHPCSAIIYGNESQFLLARPAEYLAWTAGRIGAAGFFGAL